MMSYDLIKKVNAKVIGVVLNKVDAARRVSTTFTIIIRIMGMRVTSGKRKSVCLEEPYQNKGYDINLNLRT